MSTAPPEEVASHDLFVVWAYRYADPAGYNFPVGAFKDQAAAELAAKRHRIFRGCKYDHRIYRLPVGDEFDAEEAEMVRDFSSTNTSEQVGR